jgi:peptidoglycan hydrolase-like protein with peptidoglycan-binding domain
MLKKLMITAGITLVFGGMFSYVKAESNINAEAGQTISVDIRTNDASKKGEIMKVQRFLINQGLLNIAEPNGSFGPLTRAAIKKFQAEHSLSQVGTVGPLTRAKINSILGGEVLGVSTTSPSLKADTSKLQKPLNFNFTKFVSAGSKDADVSKLQKVLIENGYLDEASATGVMDEATVLALKDFQEDNKVDMTGSLGPKTRALIALASRRLGPCAGNQQKVIVKNPNGGEVYQAGQRINVKWRTCRIPGNQNVRVDLVVAPFPPTGTNGVGLGNTRNDGREQFTLPAASAFNGNPMSFGQNFKVLIWYPNGSTVSPQDVSDNLFTINGTTIPGPTFTTDAATAISQNSATLNATIYGLMDIHNGTNQTAYFQYGTAQNNLNMNSQTSGPTNGTLSKTITGLTPNTTYYYRAAINFGPSSTPPNAIQYANIGSFTTSGSTACGSASSLTLLTPNGGQSYVPGNVINFTWLACNQGTDGIYTIALDGPGGNYIGNPVFTATSYNWIVPAAAVTGQYTVRIFCNQPMSEAACTPTSSIDTSDGPITITAPVIAPGPVTTKAASNIADSSASVSGSYVTNGPAQVWFEYGTTSALGQLTPTTSVSYTSLSSAVMGTSLQGLSGNTTYYYRFCVQNAAGQACGSIMTFTTSSVVASPIIATLNSLTPAAGIVYDNQTVDTAKFNLDTTATPYTVTNVTLTLPVSATYVAQSVLLYDGATLLAIQPSSPTVYFAGMNWVIPAYTNKVLTVKMQLGTVGVGASPTQANLMTTLTSFTATSTSTGVSVAGTESNPSGNAIYVYAGVPSLTQQSLSSNILTNGSNKQVLKFKIDANGGLISWKQLSFDVFKSTNVLVGTSSTAGITLWDTATGTQVAGTFNNQSIFNTGATGGITFTATGEQQVSSSKTYELRVNISGAVNSGDYVTVVLPSDSAALVVADSASVIIASDVDAPIIWSDNSSASHSLSTQDWTSDYLVRTLPMADTISL